MTLLSVQPDNTMPPTATSPGQAQLPAMKYEKPLYIIMAGGGTGGHIYPGLAVAEALEKLLHPVRQAVHIIWAATPRVIDQRLLGGFNSNYIPQGIRPFNVNALRWPAFYLAWNQTCHYWRAFFREHNVAAVLALGGYAAGAVAHEAVRANIPMALVNPDALAGRANRFLMRRAKVIFTQWPLGGRDARKAGDRARVVGCPIRSAMVPMSRAQAAGRLGLETERKTLVISGASLGAQTINQAIATLAADVEIQQLLNGAGESRWQILHLAGLDHAAELRGIAQRLQCIPWTIMDYCDDMAAVWSMADLAISRAGAGMCAELAQMGVPALLMPYPFHNDHHQDANAQMLCTAGSAVLVHDTKEAASNAARLKRVLMRLISEPDRLSEMAMAAKSQAKPGAASAVADWLIEQIHIRIGDHQ